MAKPGWRRPPAFKRSVKQIVDALPKDARKGARKALAMNGEEAVQIIKRDIPVDDGDLQISTTWNFGDPPPGVLGARDARIAARNSEIPPDLRISISSGGKKAPHAHLVHNGTAERFTKDGVSRGVMPPNPFFWPNIRSLRRRMKGRISRQVSKYLRKGRK